MLVARRFLRIFALSVQITASLVTGEAYADHFVGNGGVILRGPCGTDQDDAKLLLDYFEVANVYGYQVDLGPADLPVEAKLEIAMQRLERFDAARASTYRDWLAHFDAESTPYNPNLEFPELTDVGEIAGTIPAGCTLEKIVAQHRLRSGTEKRYTIKQDIYNQLDNNGKAGIRLHEIVYRDALSRGAETSEYSRLFSGLLTTAEFGDLSPEDFKNLVVGRGLYGALVSPTVVAPEVRDTVAVRYFYEASATYDEAHSFCASLPGGRVFAIGMHDPSLEADVAWQHSPAHDFMLQTAPLGTKWWCVSGEFQNNAEACTSNPNTFMETSFPLEPRRARHPFACIQSFIDSPYNFHSF